MKNQFHSFLCAVKGILRIFETEGHMRFHLVAAVYVISFCLKFYDLSASQWSILILTISSVLCFEIVNTAIEKLCDKVCTEYNDLIKFTKDAAAGAVLVSAVGAVATAFVLLYRVQVFCNIFNYFTANILSLVLLIISAVIAVLFIAIKPSKYLRFLSADKTKDKSGK